MALLDHYSRDLNGLDCDVYHGLPVNHMRPISMVGHDLDHYGLASRGQVELHRRVPASLLGHGFSNWWRERENIYRVLYRLQTS